jgi:hypothetical protein
MPAPKRDERHPHLSERVSEPPGLRAEKTPLQHITRRLKTGAGTAASALRKQTIAPVFGIARSAMGFCQFLNRGLDNAQGDRTLVCLA